MISVDEASYSEVLAGHGLLLGGLVQERLQICDTLGLAVGLHAWMSNNIPNVTLSNAE